MQVSFTSIIKFYDGATHFASSQSIVFVYVTKLLLLNYKIFKYSLQNLDYQLLSPTNTRIVQPSRSFLIACYLKKSSRKTFLLLIKYKQLPLSNCCYIPPFTSPSFRHLFTCDKNFINNIKSLVSEAN